MLSLGAQLFFDCSPQLYLMASGGENKGLADSVGGILYVSG